MDKFLKTYNLQILNHEEIKNLNRTIMSKETESVIKNLSTKITSGPVGFMGESYQTFKELTPILLQLVQKNGKEGTLPNSFYSQHYSNTKAR